MLDEEIEKNAEEVQSLNNELKEARETNFKLKLEIDAVQLFGKSETKKKPKIKLNKEFL